MMLTEQQIERYSRQIILKEVGGKGQEKLLNSRALIIGAGGLGSPAALYLAAAGVGTIGIADGDVVDLSNLQRQILHFSLDVNKAKVDSASEKIAQINPDIKVRTYNEKVFAHNIGNITKDYDFIIDGTDNFSAKFLINDLCVLNKKPFSHAGILKFYGQTITYLPGNACYRCLFKEPPPKGAVPSCSEAGIIGVVAGILSIIQATEAIRYFLGIGELLTNTLLNFDALGMNFRKVNIKPNRMCPICGDNPIITELTDSEQPLCDLKRPTK